MLALVDFSFAQAQTSIYTILCPIQSSSSATITCSGSNGKYQVSMGSSTNDCSPDPEFWSSLTRKTIRSLTISGSGTSERVRDCCSSYPEYCYIYTPNSVIGQIYESSTYEGNTTLLSTGNGSYGLHKISEEVIREPEGVNCRGIGRSTITSSYSGYCSWDVEIVGDYAPLTPTPIQRPASLLPPKQILS